MESPRVESLHEFLNQSNARDGDGGAGSAEGEESRARGRLPPPRRIPPPMVSGIRGRPLMGAGRNWGSNDAFVRRNDTTRGGEMNTSYFGALLNNRERGRE